MTIGVPKPKKRPARARQWNSTIPRSTKPPAKSGKPIRKENPERVAKRRKSYAQKLAAYRRSETYKAVEARAQGRCERTRLVKVPTRAWPDSEVEYRCIATRADGYRMTHNHKTYARFGGDELPEDVELLCDMCNALYESQHPTRKRNYR